MTDKRMVYKIKGFGEFGEKWDYFTTWAEAEAALADLMKRYPDKPMSICEVPESEKHQRVKPNRSVRAQLYLFIQLIKAKAAYPDMRTGQIIGNATNREIYQMEDLDLADAIHDWLKQMKAEEECQKK